MTSPSMRLVCLSILPALALLASAHRAHADHPSAAFGSGSGGPISTFSPATLPQGSWVAALRTDYLDVDRFSDEELEAFGAADEHVDSVDYTFATFLSVAYGVTDGVSVVLRLPHIYQDDIRESHHDMGMGEAEFEGDASGLGDLMLLSLFRLLGDESSPMQISAIAGLEVPSGRYTDRTVEGEVFELEHQPSSHSWDPLIGLTASRTHDRWSFFASGTYLFTTDGAQDTNLGDVFNYNPATVYRLLGHEPHDDCGACDHHAHGHHDHGNDGHHEHGHHNHSEHAHDHHAHDHRGHQQHAPDDHDHGPTLDIILELNGIWEGKQKVGSERDGNSGGHVLYLSPGVRLGLDGGWSVYLSTGFPIVQDVNGANHEADFRLISGVAKLF